MASAFPASQYMLLNGRDQEGCKVQIMRTEKQELGYIFSASISFGPDSPAGVPRYSYMMGTPVSTASVCHCRIALSKAYHIHIG